MSDIQLSNKQLRNKQVWNNQLRANQSRKNLLPANQFYCFDDHQSELSELSSSEIDQVSGGWLFPVVMYGIAAYSHFTARTATAAAFGRLGFMGSTFETARWFGGGGENAPNPNARG